MNAPITDFRGPYRFLSNFSPCDVRMGGVVFPSTEHAYQAAKTSDQRERERIAALATPGDAKRAGRRLKITYDDWEVRKEIVMEVLLKSKFTQKDLRERLLGTGDAELIEGNTWGDREWGCVWQDGQWVGNNKLGKLLMKLRAQIRDTDWI